MLKTYTNQQQILNSSKAIQGSRIETTDLNLLPSKQYSVTLKTDKSITEVTPLKLEMHVYTLDGIYLTGDHSINYELGSNKSEQFTAFNHLSVNVLEELNRLGIQRGQYKVAFNFLDEILGFYEGHKLWIKEISPSRREMRLQFSETNSVTIGKQFDQFVSRLAVLDRNKLFDSFVINFGNNELYQIVNIRSQEDENGFFEIVVKLYQPLPAKYGEKQQVWICEEVIAPTLDTINLIAKVVLPEVNKLAGPNFDLEEVSGQSIATGYKNWTDLLSSNVQTSQQLIDSYFSGSLSGIDLNVNYNDFENFVHYSNASERIQNFYYKLQLIESYTDRIQILLNTSGSETVVNLDDTYRKRNAVVSGFDGFEKYLFFESTGSRIYTHLTSSYDVQPWPKQVVTGQGDDSYEYFYKNVASDSVSGLSYYRDLLEDAAIYDKNNIHSLINTVPAHILNDETNEEFSTFVYMLGQHFDILWSYIKHLTDINVREEHPQDGMSPDLLYHVAKSQGFELLNGRSAHDLWKYTLGTDASGSADITQSSEKTTKELWRRLVNNLPYILKSKGTARSIKALLASYGIPSSVLTIKEYGGPSTFTDGSHFPQYIHDTYKYAWLSSGSLRIPSGTYNNGYGTAVTASVLEFRFKADSNYVYNIDTDYIIASTVANNTGSYGPYDSAITLKRESLDNEDATLYFKIYNSSGVAVSSSISNLDIFDDEWQTVALQYSASAAFDTYKLNVVKSKYGKAVYHYSSSVSMSVASRHKIPLTQDIAFSQGTLTTGKWYGHYQEVRLWSGSINNASIEEHAHSPNTYTFNVDRLKLISGNEALDPYYHLLQRFTLSDNTIFSGSFYQKSVHPNQTINLSRSIYFNGYATSASITFEPFEETYYTPSPSLAGNSLYADKVRIESSSLDPNLILSNKRRAEQSSFDKYSLDSNRVGVYFSPQNSINEDIFNQVGYYEIDDYIGDPGDLYKDQYTNLVEFSQGYWKKYENKNDFEAFFRALEIYDFTIFKYIKRLIPERANAITGLLVEPNVLERSRIRTNRPTIEDLTHEGILDDPKPELSSIYTVYTGDIYDATGSLASDYFYDRTGTVEYNYTDNMTSEFDSLESIVDASKNKSVNIFEELRTEKFPSSKLWVSSSNTGFRILTGSWPRTNLHEWPSKRLVGNEWINYKGEYTPIHLFVENSRTSTTAEVKRFFYSSAVSASRGLAYSASYEPAQIQDYNAAGQENIKYVGSKLTGPGININTNDTVDGGPVVKVTKVNKKRLVFSRNQPTTIDSLVNGPGKKSI